MGRQRGEIGQRRREQIVEAAVAIIAAEGLQNLSLSAIEEKAGMSRGQLTYYFPTKEDILLAVFDRLIDLMHQREQAGEGAPGCPLLEAGWQRIRGLLTFFILQPPEAPEFHALQYTFLSQISHRGDFRQRLASLYEHWRGHLAGDFALSLPVNGKPRVSPRTLATFVQALLHGLAIQRVADPACYDREEVLALCLDMLEHYLDQPAGQGPAPNSEQRDSRSSRSRLKE
jgi:AcrR family transcriptional regulator